MRSLPVASFGISLRGRQAGFYPTHPARFVLFDKSPHDSEEDLNAHQDRQIEP